MEMDNRFRHLRKESPDLVGWLTINTLLDEPVVQRDNVYYLTRDAMKKQNVNGAIFLDAAVSLRSRPYTLILYGYNMKTGAMFGNLRNFENGSYYRRNPFITFDSLHEQGRYVIFSAGVINVEEKVRNSVTFLSFLSPVVQERKRAIDALISTSVHSCTVDVKPDDHLLLLVTCTEKDNERRVIAARKLRDGETEQELKKQVEKSWKK
jgi:sortase B